MKTLVITGLFSPIGRRMARLASGFGIRVLGVDIKPMTKPLPGIEFVQADIRNTLIAELFKAEKVDAILHCAFRWRQRRNEEVFDSNVLGAMKLLGAAAMAKVPKIILLSSTFVYGADSNNPTFLDEGDEFQGQPGYAYVRELREIETFVSGFRAQHPDMVITVLRYANVLGGGLPSPMAQYLALPAAPTLLGFDPMLQFIHHDDVLRAIGHCLLGDYDGIFNIAAPDPIPLNRTLALAGVAPIPVLHPVAYMGARLGRMVQTNADKLMPLPWDYLRYSWVASTDRMANDMKFQPAAAAEATVREFGEMMHQHRYKTSTAYRVATDGFANAKTVGKATVETLVEARQRTEAALDELRRPDANN